MMVAGFVLWNDQVPPMFHELPLPVEVEPSETSVPLATARFLARALEDRLKRKPVFGLSHAVLRSILWRPGLLLSMKPPTALSHVMQLRTVWPAATPLPPSLNPLPSPTKFGMFQRLNPLPQARLFSTTIGEENIQKSRPSSALFHSRAPRTTLP